MTDNDNDRPIIPVWAVIDDDRDGRVVFIHLERGPAEAIATPTQTHPSRRLARGWFRLARNEEPNDTGVS